MASTIAAGFIVLPFLLLGVVTFSVPAPNVYRYTNVLLSSGLCLLLVALLGQAGVLWPAR